MISPTDIVDSPFNRRHSAGARRVGYDSLPDMLGAINGALREPSAPSFIYAYWPDFDHCAHQCGAISDEACDLLRAADEALGRWVLTQPGRDTLLLVTADHGFIDGPPQRLIEIEDFPEIVDCLTGPLSGERRAVFCHVKPGRTRDFERALHALDHACTAWASEDLIAAGRFGPGDPHPRLQSRIGDFTLEMKGDWTLRDTMPLEMMSIGAASPSGEATTRFRVGLNPTRPQQAAGILIDPPPSFACAIGSAPAATSAAEPPDDAPQE